MARRSQRRSPFPVKDAAPATASADNTESILADDASPGMFGFFREVGTRETIESLIVAILLALMFKTFEAEAFIIPTGSMAPSLNGQHIDLECENCGFQYHSGDRTEIGNDDQRVYRTQCPICQYETELSPARDADHVSNSGDRILVNKFIYDFVEPERFDVIVFKNPNNGKQNYIKRLIGLPGENILIQNGDIFLMESQEDGTWEPTIARKPPRKLRHVLQTVADTHHIGWRLTKVNWPSHWNSFGESDGWEITEKDSHPNFVSPETSESWLRYRHFRPTVEEWKLIKEGTPPPRFRDRLPSGSIIGDSYGYNGATNQYTILKDGRYSTQYSDPARENPGLHWVGDIGLEAWLDVASPSGELLFDVVEGGVHFTCAIDIATGVATLQSDDSQVDAEVNFETADGNAVDAPTAKTSLIGPGSYHIEYVNADDQIHLWINNRYIEFDAPTYTRSEIPVPQFSLTDPGDAEPLGVGVDNAAVTVTRLKVVRDIYYTSFKGNNSRDLGNEAGLNPAEIETLLEIQQMPERWTEPEAIDFFTRNKKDLNEPMFKLHKGATSDQDQFLPMGDNSPSSLDGRVWAGPNYVERDMLIGRALLVYWPHTLNKPVRFFPNFGEMGFIR